LIGGVWKTSGAMAEHDLNHAKRTGQRVTSVLARVLSIDHAHFSDAVG